MEQNKQYTPEVLCLGFFDGVHLGHQALLQEGSRIAHNLGLPCNAITFDRHPSAIFGTPPKLLNSIDDRCELLRNYGGADHVTVLPFTQSLRELSWEDYVQKILIEKLHAAHILTGIDHHFGYKGLGDAWELSEFCAQLGIGCSIIPLQYLSDEKISSSRIRDLFSNDRFDEALKLLGHAHRLSGTVVQGNHLGKSMGFPTCNLPWPVELSCPPFGVYQSRVLINGIWYPSMSDIGTKPTVGGNMVLLETHIFDYDEELYGKKITVELISHTRGEYRFDSLEALISQLQKDQKQIHYLFEKGDQ